MVWKPLRRLRKRQGKAKQAASSPAAGKPVTRQPVVRRTVVRPKLRPKLLRLLEKRLAKPGFFEGLRQLHSGGRVRLFFFQGIPVVIKNTSYMIVDPHLHGKDFERLRASFLAHQKALKAGIIKARHYRLRSAKVYGIIGDYLVMEYVAHTKASSGKKAESELYENFIVLKKEGLINKIPQIDWMRSLKKSRGIETFFLPYDYS